MKKAYFVIRNLGYSPHLKAMMFFYLQCIQPMFALYILEYASQIWSPVLKLNIGRIDNMQRYYTRRTLRTSLVIVRQN